MVPVIIRAFFDTRASLYVHLITISLIVFLASNSFIFVFSQFIAGIVAVLSLVSLQKRSQFFITAGMIFLMYSATYIGLELITQGNLESLNYNYFIYFGASALLTLLALPLILVFEKLFSLVTDFTLIELAGTNSPLLRELSAKAPGTFQHSLMVASFAEEVLYIIGGHSLLAWTGALYHDIGKMENPGYFIENQYGIKNPHDILSHAQSAEIIIDHVSKGVQIARKKKLPKQIIDFIMTHHGTRKVEYFYRLEINTNPDQAIDKMKFSYPGPIPFTREQAIVMIVDSVEAASRSIKVPTQENLTSLVDSILDHLIAENQFNDSNITFKEVTLIREIIKRKLLNVYHGRIEYPNSL